jgi:uncharacterized protein (TIGR02996 family)
MRLMHDAFLDDICANPEDDTPRLVYADWLDEQGDEDRAEFIRAQVRAWRLPDGEEKWELEARALQLLDTYREVWFGGEEFDNCEYDIKRGFVSGVAVDVAWMLKHRDWPRQPATDRYLDVSNASAHELVHLAACPGLPRTQSLSIGPVEDTRALTKLLQGAGLPGLEHLFLHDFSAPEPLLGWLVDAPPPGVVRLSLRNVGLDSLLWFATSPLLPRLTALDLSSNPLGSSLAVLGDGNLSSLQVLRLGTVNLEQSGLDALLSNPTLSGLTELTLPGVGLDNLVATSLADALHRNPCAFPNLTVLSLGRHGITADGCQRLAPYLANCPLRNLDLRRNHIGHHGLRALIESGALDCLDTLDLTGCSLDDEAARILIESNIRPKRLSLFGNHISDTGQRLLRERFSNAGCLDDDIPF